VASLRSIGTAGVLGFRIAYGGVLLAAPELATKRWLGADAAEQAPTRVALRGLGAREVALHAGALAAWLRGEPMLPWLAASVAGDVSDIVSTAASRDGLPDKAAPATAAVAGASAALTVALAVAAARQK
jgi:hypothetical protein